MAVDLMIEHGYGVNPDFKQWMGDRYIDLCHELSKNESYVDWEGFADPEDIKAILEHPDVAESLKNEPEFIKDLTAHWLYENIDQSGHTPSDFETVTFIFTVSWLFTSRFYMKMDAPERNPE
jgi:hypothetical protein